MEFPPDGVRYGLSLLAPLLESIPGSLDAPSRRVRLANADRRAFVANIAAAHGERLQRFVQRRASNPADVPDIMQEIFLCLLRVPDHQTIRAPEAYAFMIAQNVAQQYRLRRGDPKTISSFSDALADLQSAASVDPANEVIAQQSLSRLDDAFAQLSPKARSTFLYCRRDGLSMDEIGHRLGISRPMAKKYLVQALARFRKCLEES